MESKSLLPAFPEKKLIGNLSKEWLQTRAGQLGLFLNVFLAHPQVKADPQVPVYFKQHAVGEGSKEEI